MYFISVTNVCADQRLILLFDWYSQSSKIIGEMPVPLEHPGRTRETVG